MGKELLRMENIVKCFPGVRALDNARLVLEEGVILGLLGENGAGKSTLMNVLGGIYKPDSGEIFLNGKKVQINNVFDAQSLGIAFIHQELALVPFLSIAENFFLGREVRNRFGFVSKAQMYKESRQYLEIVGLNVDPAMQVSRLSIGQQQMVEIAKAFSMNAKIIVMDEPTSSLSEKEVDILFNAVKEFSKNKLGVIYISHKLSEIFELTDRVMVMRDGCYVGEKITAQTNQEELIHMMVGRELKDFYIRAFNKVGSILLEAENIYSGNVLTNCSFSVRSGEILGFYGLIGAGRTELMEAVMGLRELDQGVISINGEEVRKPTPQSNKKQGLILVPEDRKNQGLFLRNNVGFNTTITVLEKFINNLNVNGKREHEIIETSIQDLKIKASSQKQLVGKLSGGNQQKVVLGKWLAANPKIMILDEPTRGIDVGAKAEIYKLVNKLVSLGMAVIWISSELPEVINMCDRMIIMKNGKIAGELQRNEFEQSKILQYAMGGFDE